MTKTPQNDVIAGPQAVDVATPDPDAPLTDETTATLRDLCEKTSQPFDSALTERQAQRRIAALREAHGVI